MAFAALLACATSASASAAPIAHSAAGGFAITTRPALQPQFDPAVHDYVTRCEPAEVMQIAVSDTDGARVVVDQQPAQSTSFRTSLRIGAGQSFVVTAGSGPKPASYTVRCLPADFPKFTAQVSGHPQAAYYLVTPSVASTSAPAAPYVALFDNNGIPVWWYREPTGAPTNANLLPNGDLSWSLQKPVLIQNPAPALGFQVSQGFGTPDSFDLVEHNLNGKLVRTLDTVGSPTDFHEGQQLPNGDFLITSYVARKDADLSPTFYGPTTALDASFQVIAPNGTLVYSWNAAGRILPSESARWWYALDLAYPNVPEPAWDYQHIDSVEPDGDGYLVSLAHTDAVYLIRASDGAIEWKLGGTPTPQSLNIIGDPDADTDFGGQDDARVWPDGTVSVYDDGTGRQRPPRVLRFRIDAQNRSATLIQTITDPAIPVSPCCGSARLLPGGDWVVAWGGTQTVEELTASSQPVLRLTFAYPYFSYRAVPVLPGQLSASAVAQGMNTMNPRTPSGARPPALSHLSVSAGHTGLGVQFTLAWRGTVRFSIQRARAGRRAGWRCVPVTGGVSPRHGCTAFVAIGASVRTAARSGANHLVLQGRIGRRALAPGIYRLAATPLAGRRAGDQTTARFRVG